MNRPKTPSEPGTYFVWLARDQRWHVVELVIGSNPGQFDVRFPSEPNNHAVVNDLSQFYGPMPFPVPSERFQ